MKLSTPLLQPTEDLDWSAPRSDYPTDILLHQLFETQAARTPDATAVVYEDQTLSYRQLDQAADALTCRLQAAGVGPGALVALLSERSPEMVIGILAILKAGGAYLPLHSEYPAQGLAVILDDAKPAVIVLQDHLRANLPSKLQMPVLSLEEKPPATGHPIPAEVNPESAAYVHYTSGSTGQPKGVMIPHRAVCSFLRCTQDAYLLRSQDRVLQKTAYTFDVSVPEFFWPLTVGAAMVLARPRHEADPEYLVAIINEEQITTINFVPPTLALFLDHPHVNSCRSLKRVFTAGETLPAKIVGRFFAALPNTELHNAYGPTEATVWMTTWRCHAEDAILNNVPIGLPMVNTQVHILDDYMAPVASGAIGELYIGGEQVGIGYLNRQALTENVFVPNPFGEGRLYKTGDLGRYLEDGAIEFHGRIDHQVKISGLRIELGEIDATLRTHPAVRNCVVIAREERLIAYVVATGVTSNDLLQHARQTLPHYMVPAIVFLEKLPLTSNGKINKKALPDPIFLVARENEPVVPRTVVQTQLVAIWEKVLNGQPIGVTDNFFSLGGTSLQALQIFSAIGPIFGKRFSVATLFEAPTIEQLAQKISQEPSGQDWNPLVAIQLQGKNPPFFAVHGGDGNVLFYRQVSEFLGKERPFYGLQAQGLNGSPITQTSVEQLAASYLNAIRNVQPHGPYLLGGYCFGGMVAYEIAYELKAAGEEVALLVLFDASNPEHPPRLRSWAEVVRYRIPRLLSHGVTAEHVFEYCEGLVRGRLGVKFLKWNEQFHSLTIGKNDPAKLLDLRIRMAHRRAAIAYKPRPYAGKITLFRTIEQPLDFEDQPDLGWSTVAQGGLDVHNVPGNHKTLFWDDDVEVFARQVEQCIQSSLATN